MRKLLDNDNVELNTILESLLREDVQVTVREVARRHSTLRNASAFTRNATRMALIEAAQGRQNDARKVVLEPLRNKAADMTQALASKTTEVETLERDIAALVTSHAACIRAVLNHGGMASVERFWKDYKGIGDAVQRLRAVPTGAQVVPLLSQSTKGNSPA